MKRSSSTVVHDELYCAIEEGNLRNVRGLVKQVTDIHALKFSCGDTVMHVATSFGHQHLLVFFLSKGLDINATDAKYCHTPLHLASMVGRAELVQFLIDKNANMHVVNLSGRKPIHEAARNGHTDVVYIFLKNGVDAREADGKGSTLLHISCPLGNLELVQLLVNYRADIHAKDVDGQKPIHAAAYWGRKDFVEYFLNLGMSVDETDKNGQTVLHLAAKISGRDHWEVVKLLVAAIQRIGANPQLDLQDNEGKTPMHVCCHEPHTLFCLLDAGARSDIKDRDGRTMLFYFMNECLESYLYSHQFVLEKIPNFVDIDDQTKMSCAHLVAKNAYTCDMDLITVVFQNQTDMNIEDIYGRTPIYYLTRSESRSRSMIDRLVTLIRMFVDQGAYLKIEDCEHIIQNSFLKERLFTDRVFCSQCIVNKFDNINLPMLGQLPSAIPPSVQEQLKLKNSQIRLIESAVEEEIRKKNHCDVSKMVSPLLSILAIESYVSHYHTSEFV